jgi:hypothetical protein
MIHVLYASFDIQPKLESSLSDKPKCGFGTLLAEANAQLQYVVATKSGLLVGLRGIN